jgi:hypothetical protein
MEVSLRVYRSWRNVFMPSVQFWVEAIFDQVALLRGAKREEQGERLRH